MHRAVAVIAAHLLEAVNRADEAAANRAARDDRGRRADEMGTVYYIHSYTEEGEIAWRRRPARRARGSERGGTARARGSNASRTVLLSG